MVSNGLPPGQGLENMLPRLMPSSCGKETRKLLATKAKKRIGAHRTGQPEQPDTWSQRTVTPSLGEPSTKKRIYEILVGTTNKRDCATRSKAKAQFDAIPPPQQDHRRLTLQVEICGKPARALLDSGAQTNVISHTFVTENRIPWRMKEEPYELKTLERKNVSYADGNIDKETEPGILKIGEHRETITLDLAATGQFEILLGIPWLRMHNPLIDWRNNRIEMPPLDGPKGTHAWRKTPERNIKIKEISQRGIERARRKGQAIGQYWYRPEERSTVRNIATTGAEKKTVIPAAYEEFREIFTEKIEDALPAHQPGDHEIPLQPGKQPKFGPIY